MVCLLKSRLQDLLEPEAMILACVRFYSLAAQMETRPPALRFEEVATAPLGTESTRL